ncbi:hypothetical protein K402DRAFT_463567 [Aulographum hederae CBS 113979]|uniref:non-specific serine/threonine protein kinase n=1 Tax=Aulographum hederae CBS 113979 TaxID=1176131 RepID=A0A6G1H0T5_9PEZI|nr:hypothetical protein K402DRAFT_463567 [Aulographum hederae CBS 113979]
MVSHTTPSSERQHTGRQPNGTPAHAKGQKSSSAQPSKDGHAQRAAQDVEGLKDYQLGDCLGKGAFGSVYRALNWGTGETVAIKQVRLADLPKSELRVIMLEIDLLKNLNHPNIVKYNGFVKSVDSLYIILEYCENGSLHSICKNFGKFPENLVALYMSQALHGLLYLHEQGVIHRDIKGANILTTKEGLVKLADFGVATKTNGLHESSVVGTPYWMAPEVIELSGATTASDIWSLGCTVIELLDGKPPYHKLQPMPALFRIVNDEHPPIPEGASPAVRDFLIQCFQKDPNLRVSAKKLLKHPWILSAKRAESVVPVKPTTHENAVKTVQEWNEALKSPDNGSLRKSSRPSRPTSASPVPLRKEASLAMKPPAPPKGPLNLPKTRSSTEQYRSSEADTDDNWDDDFATSISPSALQLPHLRPQDNFAGLLSSEKLKAYATFDAVAEEPGFDDGDADFDGDLTVKSPYNLDHFDPMETVRPFTPGKAVKSENRRPPSGDVTPKRQPSQPKTQIMSGIPKPPVSTKPRLASYSRPATLFREDTVEDYNDLVATDDIAFERKLHNLQIRGANSHSSPNTNQEDLPPKLFDPADLKKAPKLNIGNKGGSLRRWPTPMEAQNRSAIKRSRSEVEIQKYAEDEDEDFSDIFGKDGTALPLTDSDSGSERSTVMMLHSKVWGSSSWLGDDEDEDDPFAQLEESFDQMDLEINVARDRHARLCTLVEGLIGSLKITCPDDILDDVSDQLMQVLVESPELKSVIISSHGMLPILEVLDYTQSREVQLRLLKIVNMIILENQEIQENLCFVGGIPIVSRFADKPFPREIRMEAAAFVRQMYQTSTLTLQMFISCGGLNVLVEFLEEDLETERDLVLIGVNGIWSVFELQGPTPKNDFCRIFSRTNVLYPLSLVLNRILEEHGVLAEQIEGQIVNIFLLFSQAENYVKETIADRMVLKRVLKDLRRMSPSHQITMLKFIKNLSMLATTHDSLQNSNAIEVLTELLNGSKQLPQFREISNQVLNIMYNLCRLSKTRQEDAALNGVIPLLQHIVQTEWPLKEFALPILCDMAHSGKVGRKSLWQHKGLQFYVSLLSDRYWQVTALDAITVWLEQETARVEQHLLEGSFTKAIVDCYSNPDTSADAFENLLDPLQKLLRLSPLIASRLANPDLFSRTQQKLHTKKAVVRVNLLRIIRCICDASEEHGAGLLRTYGLYDTIQRLADTDQAILVREMALDLMNSSDSAAVRRSFDSTRTRPSMRRASSSTTMTPPPLMSSQSVPPTPQHLRSGHGLGSVFFNGSSESLLLDNSRIRGNNGSMLSPTVRPGSRDSSSGSNTGLGGWSTGSSSGSIASKSRLPRTSASRMGRVFWSFKGDVEFESWQAAQTDEFGL